MILYATIIPFNMIENENQDMSQEMLKILINIIELLLISYSLNTRNSFNVQEVHLKVLTVGLAWNLADSVATNLLYFLMNATGEEVKWEYIQSAIQSNLDLIERIAIVALVQVYETLRTNSKMNIHILIFLIAKYFFTGIGFKYFFKMYYEDQLNQLGVKCVYVIIFALISKYIFNYIYADDFKTEDEKLEE